MSVNTTGHGNKIPPQQGYTHDIYHPDIIDPSINSASQSTSSTTLTFETLSKQIEDKDKVIQRLTQSEQNIREQNQNLEELVAQLKEELRVGEDNIHTLESKLIQIERNQRLKSSPQSESIQNHDANPLESTTAPEPQNTKPLSWWQRMWNNTKRQVSSVGKFCKNNFTSIARGTGYITGGLLALLFPLQAIPIMLVTFGLTELAGLVGRRILQN